MPFTVALVQAQLRSVDLLNCEFSLHLPHVRKFNILDETIMFEAVQSGLTPRVFNRLVQHFLWAEQMKADVAICTATVFEPAIPVCQKFVSIPLLRINEPMCEQALSEGHHVCVLGTLDPAIAAVATLLQEVAGRKGHTLHLMTKHVPEAAEQLDLGDWEMHNRLFIKAVRELAGHCDSIVVAQLSLLPLVPALKCEIDVPVYGCAEPLIARLARMARSRTVTPPPHFATEEAVTQAVLK